MSEPEIKYWEIAAEYAKVTGDDMIEIPGALIYSMTEKDAIDMLKEAIARKKKIIALPVPSNQNDGQVFVFAK